MLRWLKTTRLWIIPVVLAGLVALGIAMRFVLWSPLLCGTPLTRAATAGDTKKAERLLAAGAPVDQRDWRGRTALVEAIAQDQPGMVRLLLARKASLKDPGPLVTAVMRGNAAVVSLLCQAGADPNAGSLTVKGPALMCAANYGRVDIAELLVAKGADVEATDWIGQTSLHRAAHQGQLPMVEFLLAHAADINAHIPDRTPLDEAEHSFHVEVAKYLRQHGAKTMLEIKLASFHDSQQ